MRIDRTDMSRAKGYGMWYLCNEDWSVRASGSFGNLITTYGLRMYVHRGAGVPGAPNNPTGMRLGVGTTVPAFGGAGSAIASYLAGSARALDLTPVAEVSIAGVSTVTYECRWPVGIATGTIHEAAITNESPVSDIPGIDANTIARVVFGTPIVKGNLDGLILRWHHTLEG